MQQVEKTDEDKTLQLMQFLIAAGRTDELNRMATDRNLFNSLKKEFSI